MDRAPWFVWALLLALIGPCACFRLVRYPFARTHDTRGVAIGTKSGWRTERVFLPAGHSRHVREDAITAVRCNNGTEGGSGKPGGGDRQRAEIEREATERVAESHALMDYFVRNRIKSAEIVPAMESGSTPGGVEGVAGSVFVKTVIFQADGRPFAAVMREDLVADRAWLARHLRLTTSQITLAKVPYVEDLTGFPVGTIPPLGHRTRVPTLVDAQLLKYTTIVGGAGLRGFDSRLPLKDLLEATGASVIPLARPRRTKDGGEGAVIRAGGGGCGGRTATKNIPTLSWYSSTITMPTSRGSAPPPRPTVMSPAEHNNGGRGLSVPATVPLDEYSDRSISVGSECGGQERSLEEENDGVNSSAGAGAGAAGANGAAGARREGRGIESDVAADPITRVRNGDSSSSFGGRDVGDRGQGSSARVGTEDGSDAESRLRVISAAMHTVSVALLALSSLEDDRSSVNSGGYDGGNMGRTKFRSEVESAPVADGDDVSSTGSLDTMNVTHSGDSGSGSFREVAEDVLTGAAGSDAPSSGARGPVFSSESQVHDRSTPSHMSSKATTATSTASSGERAQALGQLLEEEPSSSNDVTPIPGTPGARRGSRRSSAAAGNPTREVGVVATQAPLDGTGQEDSAEGSDAHRQELPRAAGTPTLDAIGGDVHLVAVVAGKRSLTRLLHFVDLVPPSDAAVVTDQTCFVKKAWIVPGMEQSGSLGPVKVQLIMGKTLVDRLGLQEALEAMRGIKRGQLLYITGRPTADTRKRFIDGPSASAVATTHSEKNSRDKPPTYDLVCCSVRKLEDAPLVEPELVGKGDEWLGGGDYLKMDLEESDVIYVDSGKKLKKMGEYLKKTLIDDPAAAVATAAATTRATGDSSQWPALAVDCEWRPTRVAGAKPNPVCLMQLAAGERTFIVDMLHVCRPKSALSLGPTAATGLGGPSSGGLTRREALLEEALGAVLGSPGIVKVGLGPKADFQSLVRSYPQIPCFRRVCGVSDLGHVASNASSLRGKPAEEKASLSRLCKNVLGKALDKSEQCSDWGIRPLSGRQKRYAALDARATLLVHRQLVPEVPRDRMERMLSTLAYDHYADGMLTTQTLPSARRSAVPRGRAVREQKTRGSKAMRKLRAGGSRQERMLRKQLLGVTMINVSEVILDAEGLRKNWLGRALPGLTKEGAVRACIFPRGEMPTSGELPTVLRFDRHQSFVEFGNGYALLMNCGRAIDREHTSGFLDEDGSTAAWYLQGKLSSDTVLVDSEVAEFQRQQQEQLQQTLTNPGEPSVATSCEVFDGNSRNSRSRSSGSGGVGVDAVGKFLQRLADASGTPSSMLGGLPEDDPPTVSEASSTTASAAAAGSRHGVSTIGDISDVLADGEEGVGGGGQGGGERDHSNLRAKQQQPSPHLVLFARAKGRPYVYCGAVDCLGQEYVWSAGSSLGAVRFTLALREWREAAAVPASPQVGGAGPRENIIERSGGHGEGREQMGRGRGAPAAGGGGRFDVGDIGGVGGDVYGGGNSFAGLVEEGFRRQQ